MSLTDKLVLALLVLSLPVGLAVELHTGIQNIGPGMVMLFAVGIIVLTELRYPSRDGA